MLDICTYPQDILKQKCEQVTIFDSNLLSFVEEMFCTMYAENGIGLAANQVGRNIRVFIMDIEGDKWVFINPEILTASGTISINEGCLSFPGITVKIQRHSRIDVKFQDVKGNWCNESFDGLKSVCFQHELDHLNGISFIDYMSPVKKMLLNKKLKKIGKK